MLFFIFLYSLPLKHPHISATAHSRAYLISLLGAQEVFGHMLRQHVGDQRFVPASHLEHPLLLVVHTDLPQEELPGLTLQLHTPQKDRKTWCIKIKVSYLKENITTLSQVDSEPQWSVIQCGSTGERDSHGGQRSRSKSSWQWSSLSWGTWMALWMFWKHKQRQNTDDTTITLCC